nr:hypothetical protein [Tanacetum cinerariifolium]
RELVTHHEQLVDVVIENDST